MKSKWSTTQLLQSTPVHVVLSPSQDPSKHSRLVWWREHDHTNGGLWGGYVDWTSSTDTTVTDWPNANFTLFQNNGPSNRDIFCSSHHTLGDGSKILISGGTSLQDFEVGTRHTVILDPATMTFDTTTVPNMTGQRWYGSSTLLGDSRVVVASGSRYFHVPLFGGLRNGESTPSDRDLRVTRMTTVAAPVPLEDYQVAPPSGVSSWPSAREGQAGGWTQSGAIAYFGGRDNTGEY